MYTSLLLAKVILLLSRIAMYFSTSHIRDRTSIFASTYSLFCSSTRSQRPLCVFTNPINRFRSRFKKSNTFSDSSKRAFKEICCISTLPILSSSKFFVALVMRSSASLTAIARSSSALDSFCFSASIWTLMPHTSFSSSRAHLYLGL